MLAPLLLVCRTVVVLVVGLCMCSFQVWGIGMVWLFWWCFGCVGFKKGVFEHEGMKYPWFGPKMQGFESGEVQDMCGEDVSFCLNAKEAGFEIWCEPRIRVGNEKTRVI